VYAVLIIVHVIICAGLILVVLMQSAKGDGLAGMFGGGAGLSGAVFGGRGAATFLSKTTSVLAAAFIVSSIVLTLASRGIATTTESNGQSAVERVVTEQQQQIPATTPGQNQTTAPGQNQTTTPATGQDVFQQKATQPATNKGTDAGTEKQSGSKQTGSQKTGGGK